MNTVTSPDGTPIAYDRAGTGEPLVLVGGTFSYRRYPSQVKLAELLSARFTVYSYDRRGRGDSGDTAPYAIDREVEDLAAVIAAAGGHAHVWVCPPARSSLSTPPPPACRSSGSPCKKRPWWSALVTGGRRPTCASGSPS